MTTQIWKRTLRIGGGLASAALLSGAVAVAQQQQQPQQPSPSTQKPATSGQQEQKSSTEMKDKATQQQQQQPGQTTTQQPEQTTQQPGQTTTTTTGDATQSPASTQSSTSTSTTTTASGDIIETARQAGNFNTLISLIETAGLTETLKGAGPFTVFAPTDEAFAKLPASALADLSKPENKDKLKALLNYHVVPSKVMAADVAKMDGKTAKTVQGGELPISTTGGVKIGNAMVSKADIAASNGVIHVIDTVLMPAGAGAKKGTTQ